MPQKQVTVTATLGDGFVMESQIGAHSILIDQPKEAGGTDTGPNPLQYFLLSVAGCMGAVGRIIANQKKLNVRHINVQVKGDLNTDGLLGKAVDGRVGFDSIAVSVDIDADLSAQEKQAFLEEIEARCPIADNIVNTTSVSVQLQA